VQQPDQCALFGDGEWTNGPNKYMRAPRSNSGDENFSGRFAGTQGYRHLGKTNVAFCDGHAVPWAKRFAKTENEYEETQIAPNTGFLSETNSMYDLE
jgi:prepilin-type processing-associated H-X9-DG protein